MKKFFSLLLIGALLFNIGFVFADTAVVTSVASEPVTQGLSMTLSIEGASEGYVKAGVIQAALSLYDKDKQLLLTQTLKEGMYNYEYGHYSLLFDVPVKAGDIFFLSVDSKSENIGPISTILGGVMKLKELQQIDLHPFFDEHHSGHEDESAHEAAKATPQFEGNARNPISLSSIFVQSATEVLVPVTVNGVPTQGVEFVVYGSDGKEVTVLPTDAYGILRIPYTTKLNYTLTLKGGQLHYINPTTVYQVDNTSYNPIGAIALKKETLHVGGALQDGVTNIKTSFVTTTNEVTPLWSDSSMTLTPVASVDASEAIRVTRLTALAQHSIPAGKYVVTYDSHAKVDGPSEVTISATAVNEINVTITPVYFLDIYKEVDGVREDYHFKFLSHEAGEFEGKDTKRFAVAPGEIFTIQDVDTGEVQTVNILEGTNLTTLVIGSVMGVQRGNSPQTDSERSGLIYALIAALVLMAGVGLVKIKSLKKLLSLVLALTLVTSSLVTTNISYANPSGNTGGSGTGGTIGFLMPDSPNGVAQYPDDLNINMLKMTVYFNMKELPTGVAEPSNAHLASIDTSGILGTLVPLVPVTFPAPNHLFTQPNVYNRAELDAMTASAQEDTTIIDNLSAAELGMFNDSTRSDYYNKGSMPTYSGGRAYQHGLTLYMGYNPDATAQFAAPMSHRTYNGKQIPKGGEVIYDPVERQPVSKTFTRNADGTFEQLNAYSNTVFYDAVNNSYRLFTQTPLNDSLRNVELNTPSLVLTSTLDSRNAWAANYRFYDWVYDALGGMNARTSNIGEALRTSLDTYGSTDDQKREIILDYLELYALKAQGNVSPKRDLAEAFLDAIDLDSVVFKFENLMGYRPIENVSATNNGLSEFRTSFISPSEYNKLALHINNNLTATSWLEDRAALMDTNSCWGASATYPSAFRDLNGDGVIDALDHRWCSSTHTATSQHIRFGGKYAMMHYTTTLQPSTAAAPADTRAHETFGGKYDMPLNISRYGGWGLFSMSKGIKQSESPIVYATVTVDIYDAAGILIEADKVLGEVIPGWTRGDGKKLDELKISNAVTGIAGDGIISSGTDSLTVGSDTYDILPNEDITYALTSETEELGLNINLHNLPPLLGNGNKQTDATGFTVDLFNDLVDDTSTVLNARHVGDFYTANDPLKEVGNYFGTKHGTTRGAYFGSPLPDIDGDGNPDAAYTTMRLDIKLKVTLADTIGDPSTEHVPQWRMTKFFPSLLPLTTLPNLLQATWNTYGREDYYSGWWSYYNYNLSRHSTSGSVQRVAAGTVIPPSLAITDNHDAIRNANNVATGTLNVRYIDGPSHDRYVVNSDAYYSSILDATLLAKKRTGDVTEMKAASWVVDNNFLLGTLMTYGIQNTNTRSNIGAETGAVTRDATVQYNILGSTESFRQTRDWAWWGWYDSDSGTDNLGDITVNKNTPLYGLQISFARFNPPTTNVAPAVANFSYSNRIDNSPSGPILGGTQKTGFTSTVTPLTIVPEVPMLVDTPTSTHLIYAAGDKARSVAPNAYHMLYTEGEIKATAVGSLPVTDPKASQLNPLGDNEGEQLIYKGSEVSSAYETDVTMYAKSYVLDVANTGLRTTWGNSVTYADDIHNTFLSQISTDNGGSLRFDASNMFKIDGTTYGKSADSIRVPRSDTSVVNHALVIRSGRLYSVNGNVNYATTLQNSPLQTQRDLYEALTAMGLIAPTATSKAPALVNMQVGLGHVVNEPMMVNQLNARASWLPAVVLNTSGWYYEDSTALVLKEYIHEYEMPNSFFSDALPMSIPGLNTPKDKNDFYTDSKNGHFVLDYTLRAPSLTLPTVSMVYDTSVDSIFRRRDINYVVPNVSILDTYN